ncbi:hypothetical protein [Rhodovibrio salinarum]|uniref:Uncharacterized protein n=1 Tax=Rhodovibrio salinarum TaxID=1087 RepID=A0A934UZ30_9PROT|nr:hypothetical protein [Rhodovibrio salinarum]MBK1696433.1 hypothetical protein [Rhodovibrio salinarum]
MAPRLPTTAAPGAATTTPVRRQGDDQRLCDIRTASHKVWNSKRLHGWRGNDVFVGHATRPVQDESLMGPEISWCEWHCAGQWDICYGADVPRTGREMYFSFSNAADAKAFDAWREQRRREREGREDDI